MRLTKNKNPGNLDNNLAIYCLILAFEPDIIIIVVLVAISFQEKVIEAELKLCCGENAN